MKAVLLSGLCAVLLAACASQPEVAADPAAPTTAAVKCKGNYDDAPTGSSIKRRDCSSNPDVQNANAEQLLDQRRFTMPTGQNR
ncbi:hypothetical protein FHW58_005353 [Duganella sp. 1224]|uniref:hypothetical protein n=1 Tax=Duganella sp. 1224 TaxID=2587052 RepID=UPI0015C984E4|nr:hypothetical protein [Duganella sp. 1224]NYE64118.1 hypothetical protein [Duganella sp. 1224]